MQHKKIGPAVRLRVTHRTGRRLVGWDALFHVVGVYENSASVARIMITVDTAPPSAVADHVIAAVAFACPFAYTVGEFSAV